jgi:hypothetical protein
MNATSTTIWTISITILLNRAWSLRLSNGRIALLTACRAKLCQVYGLMLYCPMCRTWNTNKPLCHGVEVTAWTQDEAGNLDEIMGVRHKTITIEGVQFHPESILMEHGHDMLRNFLNQ